MKPHLLTVALLAISTLWTQTLHAAHDQLVYIGTYTGGKSTSKGIYVLGLDSKTGKLEPLSVAAEAVKPSFLAIHPSKKFLYSLSENDSGGAVTSFSIDTETGKLTKINEQTSGGRGPCHVSVDATGKVLMTAHYGSGHVNSFAIKEDGSLSEAVSTIQQGPPSKANPKRQEGPHAHSINVSPDNRFAFAADLGCDKVFIYQLDPATATLKPNEPAFAEVPPGGGPRHFAFHPNGKFAYTNNELTMTVTSFSYDTAKGALTPQETLSTLPEGEGPGQGLSTAEVQVHPNGKFLYVSNRGHDTIAIFRIDEASGKLKQIEVASSVVKTPRNFGIDPTGKWLIAAGQSSNDLAIFAIDEATGKLTSKGQVTDIGQPVCVKFLPVP